MRPLKSLIKPRLGTLAKVGFVTLPLPRRALRRQAELRVTPAAGTDQDDAGATKTLNAGPQRVDNSPVGAVGSPEFTVRREHAATLCRSFCAVHHRGLLYAGMGMVVLAGFHLSAGALRALPTLSQGLALRGLLVIPIVVACALLASFRSLGHTARLADAATSTTLGSAKAAGLIYGEISHQPGGPNSGNHLALGPGGRLAAISSAWSARTADWQSPSVRGAQRTAKLASRALRSSPHPQLRLTAVSAVVAVWGPGQQALPEKGRMEGGVLLLPGRSLRAYLAHLNGQDPTAPAGLTHASFGTPPTRAAHPAMDKETADEVLRRIRNFEFGSKLPTQPAATTASQGGKQAGPPLTAHRRAPTLLTEGPCIAGLNP